MREYFNIGTFNVSTLQSKIRKEQLAKDLTSYDLDILCIQETKIEEGLDINIDGHRLVCFSSNSRYYGNGFLISKRWIGHLYDEWKVSDRICVIQLLFDPSRSPKEQGRTNLISIINVYAPTSQRSVTHPEEKDRFYSDLNNTIEKLKNKSILFVCGDFNAKVGRFQEGDTCVGHYSKGHRNENGHALVDLCEDKHLFICNSAFDHPSRHQTTWIGRRRDKTTDKIVNIYNQIDYTICQQRHKHLLKNSRSYAGTLLSSDHKLVKTNLILNKFKLWKRKETKKRSEQLDISKFANKDTQIHYKEVLDSKLKEERAKNDREKGTNETTNNVHVDKPVHVNERWKTVQTILKQSGKECVGAVNNVCKKRRNDTEIESLSLQQKDLRLRIQNTKDHSILTHLKAERNKILHAIRKKQIKQRNDEIKEQVENISNANNSHAMFKATKLLNRKKYENPKVENEDNRTVTRPNEILNVVSNHFKNKFVDESVRVIEPFQGEPRPLTHPITKEEVRESLNSLSCNKAPGEDEIPAELLKYGTTILDETIADLFNTTFSAHQNLDINNGILIAIQKPGKKKGPPNHLRPITLLNALRKSLSIITLNRIRPYVEKYLSNSQSGFRSDRSTSDVVWTHKWLSAKAQSEDVTIKISGIDMSAAFDTISRQETLNIIENIVNEDERRLIRFLLSNTKIETRIQGATNSNPFTSNIGTPQGDSLSPVLFTIYLENALREVRHILPKPRSPFEIEAPSEIAYADDVDFIAHQFADIERIEEILKQHQLKVNVAKTDFTTISKNEQEWKHTKKVGSLIGDNEDVARRKQLSNVALHKLHHVWQSQKGVKFSTKIQLYKSLVKSVLLYNCGTWALTQSEEEKLNSFHRKQLRKILNIRYPARISNKALYKVCRDKPISITIAETRWKLFGHILRRDKEIPANKATRAYFITETSRFVGRPVTTLPILLKKDLAGINHHLTLSTTKDLDKITSLAQNRRKWRALVAKIVKAAEATQSENWKQMEDWDATRH